MTASDAPDTGAGTPDRAAGDRAFGTAAVGLSLVVWWPAFTLGAWGTLFFEQMLSVWVAATVSIVIVIVQRRGRVPVWRVLTLAVPSLWLLLTILDKSSDLDLLSILVELIGGLVGILGLPFTLWTLLHVLWPDMFDQLRVRARVGIAVVVATVAVASFLLGVYNDRILTCGDFDISGNSRPPGCAQAPAGTPTPSAPATPTPTPTRT